MMRLVLLCGCLLGAGVAHAQSSELPSELSWAAYARMVLEVEPRLSHWRAGEEASEADEQQSGKLENPTLTYTGYGRTRGASEAINASQHQIQVEQRLPIWGARGLRRERARAARAVVRLDQESERAALLAEARSRFVSLLFAQERAHRIEAAQKRMAEQRVLIEGRVAAGYYSAYELTRAKLEESRLQGTLQTCRAELIAAQGNLAELALRPGLVVRAVGELAPPNLPAPERGATTPGDRAAEARVLVADANVRQTARERWPDLSVQLGAYFTTGGDSASALGGLSMSLPSFDTGRALMRRAQADKRAAEGARDAALLFRAARLDAALRELEQQRRAYEVYAREVHDHTLALTDMVQASYDGGRVSAFVLLDTTRDLLLVELEELAALEELVKCDARARAAAAELRFE